MCAARWLHGGNPSGKVFSFSPLPNYNIISSAPQHCWLFIIAKFRMRRVLTSRHNRMGGRETQRVICTFAALSSLLSLRSNKKLLLQFVHEFPTDTTSNACTRLIIVIQASIFH
jgi:hypothetical protein